MTKTINNYTKSGGSGSQETYEPLFTELKAEAKKLHQITLLLMKNEDVYKEGEIRNLVDSIEEALRDSLLSGEGR